MPTKSTDTRKIKELKNLYNIIEIILTRDDAEPTVFKGKLIRGFKFSNNQILTNLDSTGKGSENVLHLKPDTSSSNDVRLDIDRELERKIQLHRKYDERIRLAISIWETYPDCSKPPMSNPSPKMGLHELKAWAWQELKKAKECNKPKSKKNRRKAPTEVLKEARERQAGKELAKNPSITCRDLGKLLGCHETTVTRMKAWKGRGVLSYEEQEGHMTRQEDDSYNVDGVVREKPEE